MRRALMLVLLVPLVAGCGAERRAEFDDSSRAMADAGSSRIEMTLAEGKNTIFTGAGVVDYERNLARIELRSPREGFEDFEFEARFIDRTMYGGWLLLGKKRWLKEADYEPAGTAAFVPGMGGPRPDRILEVLFKSSKKVEVVGDAEIRGVSARHYRVSIDPKKADEYSGPLGDPVIDAWIDDDGLVRRLRLPEEGPEPAAMTVDLFDFGVAVEVEAPPAEEIITERELEELFAKQCSQQKQAGKGDGGICTLVGGSD